MELCGLNSFIFVGVPISVDNREKHSAKYDWIYMFQYLMSIYGWETEESNCGPVKSQVQFSEIRYAGTELGTLFMDLF